MATNRAYPRVAADVAQAKRSGRRAGLVALGIAGLVIAGAMFDVADRTDELQVVLYGLGGLISTLGGAFVIRSFLPTDSHPLVTLLRDRIGDISRIDRYNVTRNNAFVAIRLELGVVGGVVDLVVLGDPGEAGRFVGRRLGDAERPAAARAIKVCRRVRADL